MKQIQYICEYCKRPEPARMALGIETKPALWIRVDSHRVSLDFCSWSCAHKYIGVSKI